MNVCRLPKPSAVDPIFLDFVADDPFRRIKQRRRLHPVASGCFERILKKVFLVCGDCIIERHVCCRSRSLSRL